MRWPSESQLEELIERFHAVTIPASEFTHAAHLVVGLWHVRTYGEAEALVRMKSGILRLNDAHGTPNSDTRGYHETITHVYVTLLARFARAHADLPVAAAAHVLLDSPLARREALFDYYSRELLMSVAARRGWMEPDLKPLTA